MSCIVNGWHGAVRRNFIVLVSENYSLWFGFRKGSLRTFPLGKISLPMAVFEIETESLSYRAAHTGEVRSWLHGRRDGLR